MDRLPYDWHGRLRFPIVTCTNRRWKWDGFIAWSWEGGDGQRRLIAVNYAGNRGQCYVRLPFADLGGRTLRLKDLTGPASYDRDGNDLASRGLYLDLPPWGYHVFEMTTL